MFDLVSGYRHKPIPPNSNMTLAELRKGGYVLDEHAWLNVGLIVVLLLNIPIYTSRISVYSSSSP